MTGSIYFGTPTAWSRSLSRERRLQTRQTNRVIAISVLTVLSLILGVVLYMGAFDREWLEVLGTICIFCNIPLIVWLGRMYIREWQRENQIRKQYKG